jgi:hypothetical protein
MPNSDMVNTLVIGAMTGHQRSNWVLGRLLRDFDNRHDVEMDNEESHKSQQPAAEKSKDTKSVDARPVTQNQSTVAWEALRVSIYEFNEDPPCPHGVPRIDWVWLLGIGVIIVQFIVAILAWILDGSWATFLITASGSVLALVGGSLPQWKAEKWACPKNGGSTVAITQGNGSRHVVVIKGKRGHGLDLEVLAQGTRTAKSSISTRLATMVLALLWIVLLITVAGMKQGTWCKFERILASFCLPLLDLIGIGLLGSIQNLLAAGIYRHPGALGVHLKFIETLRGPRVADVLKALEQKHPFVGTALLPVFFPGGLRVKHEDIQFWNEAKEKRLQPNQYGTQV